MAGSGDTTTYRRLRTLHGFDGYPYSTRVALHTAIGILFVGAGRYSFGRSNLAIASMVIAFFPRYTNTFDDHRTYLQAWRHLWALAIEPRCVATTDLDTLKAVVMPLRLDITDVDTAAATTTTTTVKTKMVNSPYLMEAFEGVNTLTGGSPRYTSPVIDLAGDIEQRRSFLRLRTVFVQRKAHSLDYTEDPKGNRSIAIMLNALQVPLHDVQNVLTSAIMRASELSNVEDIVKEFTPDPLYRGFIKAFGGDPTLRDTAHSFTHVFEQITLESMLQTRPEMLTVFLQFFTDLDPLDPWSKALNIKWLQFALLYDASKSRDEHDRDKRTSKTYPLIHKSLVASALEYLRVKNHVKAQGQTEKQVGARYWQQFTSASSSIPTNPIISPVLATLLALHDVPSLDELDRLYTSVVHLDRRAVTTLDLALKDRYTLSRTMLRKLVLARAMQLERQRQGKNATWVRVWTDQSLTSAVREWIT